MLYNHTSLEKELLETVKRLDKRRAAQVLDFARWLQTQGHEDDSSIEEEQAWEAFYRAHQEDFRAMAREALQELDAGETLEITIEEGRIHAD